jgi:acetyl-CoA synthetase
MASTSLDQASDNNVAEIMDAEDPLLFYIRLVLLETKRDGAYHSWIHGVYCYTFKNVFNYKDNDIFGVPLILVG